MSTPHGPALIALRVVDHAAWFRIARAAIVDGGSRKRAAERLGVSATVVARWIDQEPTLVDGIEMRGAGRPAGVRNKTRGAT